MRIGGIATGFDDGHLRRNLGISEKEEFFQNIFSLDGFPGYAIDLSSSIDNFIFGDCRGVTRDEMEAIESYVGNSFEYINKSLAAPEEASESIASIEIKKNTLTKAIEKMPISEMTFYRAAKTLGRSYFETLVDRLENGSISRGVALENKTFLSFTSNPYALRSFAGDQFSGEVEDRCIIYKMDGGLRSISKISPVESECEGILTPGSIAVVSGVTKLNILTKSSAPRSLWLVELKRDLHCTTPILDFYGNPR
ncbi:ADP-ribosyltransferase [Burkholderia ubonensis]|uniref:ADP-ribosyltransferase n=1 Tax=Burkholderia ubonensis TaxID=101571 RepID=UPI0009B4E8E2|nr:ADP-ribosyltransferase [Burkholderia ubonensis]